MAAAKTWRRLQGQNQLPKVIKGVKFRDGIEVAPDPPLDSRRHRKSAVAPMSVRAHIEARTMNALRGLLDYAGSLVHQSETIGMSCPIVFIPGQSDWCQLVGRLR